MYDDNQPTPPWEYVAPPCAEIGTEIFFPPDKDDPITGRMPDTTNQAKKICGGCEYKFECGEWAIRNESHGVWGGMSPRERQVQRRKRGIKIYIKSGAPKD